MQFFLKTLLFFSLALQNSFGANSSLQNHELSGAKTALIASFYEQNGVQKLVAGVEFQLQEGWKIYGNDDSGMGMPPEFNFSASQNYKSHNIFYPQALDGVEKIGTEEIKYKYYKNSTVFPIFIEILDKNQPTKLNLKLSFALCKDVCVPVNQEFSLIINQEIDKNSIAKIEKFYGQNLVEKNLNSSENFSEIDMSFGDAIKVKKNPNKIYLMILLAMLGGLILNIMPCVLPVISIKLISVLKHSGAPISKIRFSFFATIIGILSCFIVLAFFSYIIQSAGSSLGWGFQFQNPFFLTFLIIILTLFIAELLGIFEISFSQILATFLDKKISEKEMQKNIFIPNFLSGILAVLLATPCSAPFLGSAISFALTQDFLTILLIFIFIGIGFSTPYIILIASPQLINLLPKPGKWMLKIKHLMAGFLLATAVWITFVLSNTIGIFPSLLVSIFSILIFFSLKIKTKIIKIIFVIILIILSFTLPFDFHERQAKLKNERNSYWQVFDESILQNLISENKIIIVDVTADWCLTCKFNKILVLNDDEIVNKLKSGAVIGLRADITQPDSDVMKFLAKHDRYAIPFNAVYGPKAKNGILASEFLNKKQLLDLIEKAQ
jgi:suppressor for copper-sensitivity B